MVGIADNDDEDIAFAAIGQLSAWLSCGALTSRRLTEIYLARIDALGAKLECFATVTRDRALAEADAADALLRAGVNLGPLHGIPYGLKDLFDTKGITTGWGAEPFRNRVPDSDATIVRKLRAAGAVLLGKTTVGALAYNDIWYGGWTRNPWNLNEGSSGSSAGSASASAMGLCAFAIGTETLGSMTSPCQRCGTTGLRPRLRGNVPKLEPLDRRLQLPSTPRVPSTAMRRLVCLVISSPLNARTPPGKARPHLSSTSPTSSQASP